MSKLFKIVTGSLALLMAGIIAVQAPQASAQSVTGSDSSSNGSNVYNIYPNGGVLSGTGSGSLGNLAVLDALFNNGSTGILSNNGSLNLGDFILLRQAFANSNITNS